ncbi:MAG TPA: hypothetical protein VIQ30_25545 [Pseudonocardia sp.]
MTDPKHAWPPPHATHRRRGGAHRAAVVRHPRRVVSAAMGLAGVLVVALAATMSPQTAVDAAVPPVQAAAPSAPVPVFELPASSGRVVVWPVRAVADTDPIDPTTAADAPAPVDMPETTVPATTEGTADPVEPPAPTTTQPPTRTHRPRPTPTPVPTPVSCSPGGVA